MLSVAVNNKQKLSKAEHLWSIYQQQSALYQKLLQLKALIFKGQSKKNFIEFILKAKLFAKTHPSVNATQLHEILEQLVKLKLLAIDFTCDVAIIDQLTQAALSEQNPQRQTNLSILNSSYLIGYEQSYLAPNNVRTVRIAIYLNDVEFFVNKQLNNFLYCSVMVNSIIEGFAPINTDSNWLASRSPIIKALLCCAKLSVFFRETTMVVADLKHWLDFFKINDLTDVITDYDFLQSKFLQIKICMAANIDLAKTIKVTPAFYTQEALGACSLLMGDFNKAERYFITNYKIFSKIYNKQEWYNNNLYVIFYALAVFGQNNYLKTQALINAVKKVGYNYALVGLLQVLLCLQQNCLEDAKAALASIEHRLQKINSLSLVWVLYEAIKFLLANERKNFTIEYNFRKKFLEQIVISNFFAAQLYAECLRYVDPGDSLVQAFIAKNYFPKFSWLKLLAIKQPWEYVLDQLRQVVIADQQLINLTNKRLVWLVDPEQHEINAVEQNLKPHGVWSGKKPIALKRFYYKDLTLGYITEHDLKVIKYLSKELNNWRNEEHFSWDYKQAIKALIGHPLIFDQREPNLAIELVKGELELKIAAVARGYLLSLKYHYNMPTVILEQETINRYRVIDYPEAAVNLAKIIPKTGLTAPKEAQARIIDIIHNTKLDLAIVSDVVDDQIPSILADASCGVQLLPYNNGLKITLVVRPLGENGPYYPVAYGPKQVIANMLINEQTIKQKAIRDFAQEQRLAAQLIKECPSLSKCNGNTNEWHIDDIADCLELLMELDAYNKVHNIKLEWPKGQIFNIKHRISVKNLRLAIKTVHNWFEYDGALEINQGQVIELKNLMELLEQSYGRFIKMEDGQFLALTENFKQQLAELKTISDHNKIYHLNSKLLTELATDAAQLSYDTAWQQHLQRLSLMEQHSAAVPSNLKAKLRDYQQQGFLYLSKLAHWQIGACLADDMGLGKTIQAIAWLLEQTAHGPALVVAPTSVCFIWLEELTKFAPTLTVYTLNNINNRKATIDAVTTGSLLICSYHLLSQVVDLMVGKMWQAIVLDEAQAIKNADTKRWSSVMQLTSNCRVALTGTPIENHLGELWSIFQFLNPGLLGSLTAFQQRFVNPIVRTQDPIAKQALKNLICPYILRRMKAEVLQELPAKIEQTVLIEPTNEELAFYEAVRTRALERIQQLKQENLSNKRFSILAEITRLRQACCHAALVDENINIVSSKLKTFLELVKNLIANQHKVLIFSQYVRYLAKIKELLTTEQITYQYLDGSTPNKERPKIVATFQAGQAEVFLISLKAGGTGLNLTIADYVIILDPWWNPAIEDQAADRAHRIGQQRTVTVYRLVMKNSIEEKIIKLHQTKRNLANDLLSGSDVSGKLTEEELLGLIL